MPTVKNTDHETRSAIIVLILQLILPTMILSETVGVFRDSTVSGTAFAAAEVKTALQARGHTVELKALDQLSGYSYRKIVIAPKNNTTVYNAMTGETGGSPIGTLGVSESYALRTTNPAGGKSYWAFGGDSIGTMYGGLELADVVKLYNFDSTWTKTLASPYMVKRGIKYHVDLDCRTPSYSANCTANRESIAKNWDMNYWKSLLDAAARCRFNSIVLWSANLFSSMVLVPEYPLAALDNVYRSTDTAATFNSLNCGLRTNMILINSKTISQKTQFFNEVMQYGASRGVYFHIFTWNAYLYGAEQCMTAYNLTNYRGNTGNNRDFFYKSALAFLRAYPLVKGLGAYAGEQIQDISAISDRVSWVRNTYCKAIDQVKVESPNRSLEFNLGDLDIDPNWDDAQGWMSSFTHPWTFETRYSGSRLVATTQPDRKNQIVSNSTTKKFWMNCRDEDAVLLRWGNPVFMKEYIKQMPISKTYGVQIGSNSAFYGGVASEKDSANLPRLYIEKHWLKAMPFGYFAYDTSISVNRFKDMAINRFSDVNGANLYHAWQSINKIREVVTRFFYVTNDYEFSYEFCAKRATGVTKNLASIKAIAANSPLGGSGFISCANWANGTTNGITPLETADSIESLVSASGALGLTGAANAETKATIGDIRAGAVLGLYYADKIRAAAYWQDGQTTPARASAQLAYCHFFDYISMMKARYDSPRIHRMGNMHFDSLMKYCGEDVKDIGGTIPVCVTGIALSPKEVVEKPAMGIRSLTGNAVFCELPGNASYTVKVFRIDGKKIVQVNGKAAVQGVSWISFGATLSKGVYIVELKSMRISSVKRFKLL